MLNHRRENPHLAHCSPWCECSHNGEVGEEGIWAPGLWPCGSPMIQPTLPLSNVKSGELAFVMSLSSFSALAALQHLLLEVWCTPRLHQAARTRCSAAGPCAVSLFSSFHPDQSLPVRHIIPPRAHLFWKMIDHFKLRCLVMIMTLSYLFSWLFLRESDQS